MVHLFAIAVFLGTIVPRKLQSCLNFVPEVTTVLSVHRCTLLVHLVTIAQAAQDLLLHALQDITVQGLQIRIKNVRLELTVRPHPSNQLGVQLVCMALETQITLMSLLAVSSAAEDFSQRLLLRVSVLIALLATYVLVPLVLKPQRTKPPITDINVLKDSTARWEATNPYHVQQALTQNT
jgi:hypothetical protein